MGITNILKGVGGDFEIGRVLLSTAVFNAVVSPVAFQAWEMHKGGHFVIGEWCVAYPAGLAALVAAGLLGVGNKEKSVAAALQTRSETAAIATPPEKPNA